MNAVKEAPDYLHDEHLSQGTKTYLNVLNGGGPAVESLPVPDARRVLADLQAAVPVDLSGVEESERTIESEGRTLRLNLVRPEGTGRERLPGCGRMGRGFRQDGGCRHLSPARTGIP